MILLSSRSIGLRGMRVALKLTAAGSPVAVFLFTQIYANPITE